MDFTTMTFPLIVDFAPTAYWIGEDGPYKYGTAATEFFSNNQLDAAISDRAELLRRLKEQLKTFGGYLQPFADDEQGEYDYYEVSLDAFLFPDRSMADCRVCYAFHPVAEGASALVERVVFQSLQDFLYVEMCRSIQKGNAPRQCRLCRKWFLHEQGDKTVYCSRFAPGMRGKTCREVGARAKFERKIADEDVWRIYKRAYKKYYARVMKGAMPRAEFDEWVLWASEQRAVAALDIRGAKTAEEKAAISERLRVALNQK